jgi:hypothetical protein
MRTPTKQQIIDALKVPEIDDRTDSMGRVVRKNNYSQVKVNKAFNASKPKGKGKYD